MNTALGSDDARFATTQNGADIVTLCTSAAVAATSPSATTEFCLDNEAVPPHDLLNASSLVSASVPAGDHTWPVISPNRTSVVASFAPAASAGASPAKPDLRPDHPPIPPPVLNIWAPVSANTSGGSGTWSLRSATWTDIYGDTPATMSPQPGFAIFQGIPGLVTVDDSPGAVSISGMNFSVDGYMLTGDALSLVDRGGDSPTIEVGDGGTGGAGYKVIINNVLIGADGLTKAGAGTLTLTGSNTYTGQTDIKGGKLSLTGNGSIADSNSVVIDGVGTLDVSGTTTGASVKELGGRGAIVLGDENLEVSGDSSFEGVISGSGGLTVSSGFLTLVGANTYTGLTTVDQGAQLQLGSVHTGSVAGDILNQGTLSFFFDDADLTYGGVISGDGGFEKEGTGTLTLTGANTFTGGMFVIGDAGGSTLAVSSDANLGAPGSAVTLEGGTLEAAASFTLTHPLVLLSAPTPLPSTVQVDSGATLTVANGIAGGSSDSLIKTGPGTLLLAAMNGYGGSTLISEGTLALTGLGSLAASSSVIDNGVFDISGTALDISNTPGTVTIRSLSGNGTVVLDGQSPVGGQNLQLSNASDDFSGVMSGNGALILSGGAETLSGVNTYFGSTDISNGTLALAGGGSIANSFLVFVNDGGTLDISHTTNGVTINGVVGNGSIVLGSQTLTLADQHFRKFSGVIREGLIYSPFEASYRHHRS